MADVRDTKNVTGAQRLAQRIRTLQSSVTFILEGNTLQNLLLRRTKQRFLEAKAPDGTPWAPLKPSTIRRKRNFGVNQKKILMRTGSMYDAIKIVRRSAAALASATGAGFSIGIEDPDIAEYARRHQLGEGIVQRRFMGISRGDVKAVDDALRREIKIKNRLT